MMNKLKPITAGLMVMGVLSACSTTSQVQGVEQPKEVSEIVIGVPNIPHGQTLGDAYKAKFEQIGYPNSRTVPVENTQRIEALQSGEITMTFGCIGELYEQLDPADAENLSKVYLKSSQDEYEWRMDSLAALTRALPTDLATTDPGIFQPCDDDTLPQNIIPLYVKPVMNRQERTALNYVTGKLSADEFSKSA